MKATTPPVHFPERSPQGPWGVDTIGKTWFVIHRETLAAKAIGRVGGRRINYFDRAMEVAHERNQIDAAERIGETGVPATEIERLKFEAWMRGHCWELGAEWTGTGYRSVSEQGGWLDQQAMMTRRLWAAWRDRAALAAAEQAAQRAGGVA